MINRNAKPPILPRPSRCRRCGGAIHWDTAYIEGKRIDSYRCIMCGRSSEDGDIGITAVAEKRREKT